MPDDPDALQRAVTSLVREGDRILEILLAAHRVQMTVPPAAMCIILPPDVCPELPAAVDGIPTLLYGLPIVRADIDHPMIGVSPW